MRVGRDWFGALIGLATFLVGVALLLMTFKIAFDIFGQPSAEAVGIERGKAIDVNETARLGSQLVVRIIMLLVMCFVASLIANRGIKLYSSSLTTHPVEPKTPAPMVTEESNPS